MSEDRERMSLAGTHRAKAIGYEFGYADTGSAQVVVMFKLSEEQGAYTGKTIAWFGSFHPNAVKFTTDALRRCGWDTDDISQLDGIYLNEVEIVCEDENYQDKKTGEWKTTTKVKWVNSPSKLNIKNKMDANQLAAFAAQMRGEAVASRQRASGGASSPASGGQRQQQQPAQRGFGGGGGGGGYQRPAQNRGFENRPLADSGPGADAPYTDDDIPF